MPSVRRRVRPSVAPGERVLLHHEQQRLLHTSLSRLVWRLLEISLARCAFLHDSCAALLSTWFQREDPLLGPPENPPHGQAEDPLFGQAAESLNRDWVGFGFHSWLAC